MKKRVAIAGCAIVILFITVFSAYIYYGGFKKVTAVVGEHPDMYIAYKLSKGEYNVQKNVKEVENVLEDNMMSVNSADSIAVYFDASGDSDANERRYASGYVITEEDYNSFVNSGEIQKAYFPNFEAVYATFPLKTKLSVFIARKKIHTEIIKYAKENGISNNSIIEIYGGTNRLIEIYMPAGISQEEILKIFNVS